MLNARPLAISQIAAARSLRSISNARRSRTPCMSSALTWPAATMMSVTSQIAHAGRQCAFGHAEHAAQAAVGDQQPAGVIEHQQALQHVVQRGVEAEALLVQRARGAFALFGARLCRLGRLQHLVAAQVAHCEQNAAASTSSRKAVTAPKNRASLRQVARTASIVSLTVMTSG